MMRRLVVIGLVVVLVASAALFLVPLSQGTSSAGVSSSSHSPISGSELPDASIAFRIMNGYGYDTRDFYPGEVGWGSFYFTVTDPLDRAVNVTLTDPNATRDGVPTPAFHYEATLNSTTNSFNSYQSGVGYTFPATQPYGGGWTVNFSAPNGGSVLVNITTFVYYVSLDSSVTGSTLPGQSITLFWSLLSQANGATLYTHATNVWLTGTYVGNGTVHPFFSQGRVALTPASAGIGQWSGLVPANASPDYRIDFEVYAITNVSGRIAENESEYVDVEVGSLVIHDYGLTVAPPTCELYNDYYFLTGSLLAGCVEVGSDYFGEFTPISGLPITVGYWNGSAHVHPTGAPAALTSNYAGEAAFTFNATSPPFVQQFQYPGTDALNFTVSVPGATGPYAWTAWLNATWTLFGFSTSSGVVSVSLDHTQYFAGETATASWTITSTNLTKTGAITANYWEVYGAGTALAFGAISTQNQTGSFTFPITESMVSNTIYVYVVASNATDDFDGYAYAAVDSTTLLLTSNSYYYTPGSTASVTAVLNGGGAGAVIQYELWGYWADQTAVLADGTVANGSAISTTVATNAPPLDLEFKAWATVAGQVVATNEVELVLEQGYTIQLGITTTSSYSDGSYQPGQTVQLSYAVVAVGGASLPKTASFELYTLGYPGLFEIQNVGISGTLSYTIPSNAVQGTLLVELEGSGALYAGECFGGCVGILSLQVNPHPSVLNLELGAGSGLTVGWLILLVLILIVAAVVVLLVLRRRGGRSRSPPTSTMSPPAPAPSTEPPQEWQAPPAAPASSSSPPPPPPPDDSPPGLPTPKN